MKHLCKYLLLSTLLPLVACNDDDADDYTYPSVITELVEANSNASQLLTDIRTDAGATYTINSQQIKTSRPDTTYRCICSYEKTGAATADIYSIKSVVSMLPKPADAFNTHPKDPVHVISTWKSDRYINMQLRYLTLGEGQHTFSFCEEKSETDTDGKTTVYVSLLHQRPTTDTEAYSEKLYLSLPIYNYAKTFDNIVFTIPTYDGAVEYKYALK